MSNLIYDGLYFQNELLASWKLQNQLSLQTDETQEMQFPLLNYLGDGYHFSTQTVFGQSPNFILRKQDGTSLTDLLSYDSLTSRFTFNFPLNIPTPSISSQAANKGYVDAAIGGYTPPSQNIQLTGDVSGNGLTGSAIPTTLNKTLNQINNAGDLNIGSHKLTNVLDPTSLQDAATKNYVDTKTWTTSKITDFAASVVAFRLDQFAAPTSDVNLGNRKIISLATPSASTDAVNKSYVDASVFNINTNTTGSLAINRLANYPASATSFLRGDGTWATPAGGGTVTGPVTSTDTALSAFSGTSGQVLKNTGITVDASNNVTIPGILYVNGSVSQSIGQYGFLNFNGAGSAGGTSASYGIISANRIRSPEFNATSSKKIKNIISESKSCLKEVKNIFERINFYKYTFKDSQERGTAPAYGVIAEQLKEVLPQAVTSHFEYVPNIYQKAKFKAKKDRRYDLGRVDYTLRLERPVNQVIDAAVSIRIYDKNNNFYDCDVLNIHDDIIEICSSEELSEQFFEDVFVYGTYEDCPAVSKDRIFEMGMMILQDMMKRIEKLEEQVTCQDF